MVALLEKRLGPEDLSAVHQHADGCPRCFSLIAGLAEEIQGKQVLDEGTSPKAAQAIGLAETVSRVSITPGHLPGRDLAANDAVVVPGYRLLRVLGSGGMGVVYEGVQESIGRRVAVKVLRPELAFSPEVSARLFNEACAVNVVMHPSLVSISEFGRLEDGSAYLVMEYLEGDLLRQRFARRGPEEIAATLRLLRQVASALSAAHKKGIIHRDLKPDNVMIVRDPETPLGERVKILDFGLAKLQTEISSQREGMLHTHSGAIVGTPLYMAPEQCRGTKVDERADVYSLGVMLYELMSGEPPFRGASFGEVIAQQMLKAPRPLREVAKGIDPGLSELTARMLEKDPGARPSMQEVADTLGVLTGEVMHTLLPPRGPRRTMRRRLSRAVPLALCALVVVPGGAMLIDHLRSSRERASSTRLVYVPGGTFSMGSTASEIQAAYELCQRIVGNVCDLGFFEREEPARQVRVSPFYMDRTEVTNQEFADWLNGRPGLTVEHDRIVRERGVLLIDLYPRYGGGISYREGGTPRFASRPGVERKPVTQVSYHGAQRFCESQGKALPTEAQWEFAARGEEGRRFAWGDAEPTCEGVAYGRRREFACSKIGPWTQEVGTSRQDRTPLGILDLSGNVSEWVRDRLVAPYPPCSAPCTDPVEDAPIEDDEYRVVRGGNWAMEADSLRGASRSRLRPGDVQGTIGFRCAASAKNR